MLFMQAAMKKSSEERSALRDMLLSKLKGKAAGFRTANLVAQGLNSEIVISRVSNTA